MQRTRGCCQELQKTKKKVATLAAGVNRQSSTAPRGFLHEFSVFFAGRAPVRKTSRAAVPMLSETKNAPGAAGSPLRLGAFCRRYEASDFVIQRRLQEGTHATVYAAVFRPTQHVFALKVFIKADMDEPALVENEARIHRKLTPHPYIVAFYGFIETDREIALVLECAEHGDLFEWLQQADAQARSAAHLLAITRQLVQAVQHCHANGVVHCDIKLENIFIDAAGVPKLGDFGLAADALSPLHTRARGTYETIAPEMLQPVAQTTPAADMWSLGATLYEMFGGCAPFCVEQDAEATAARTKDKDHTMLRRLQAAEYLKWPEGLKRLPWMQQVIEALLVADPKARHTAEQLLQLPALQAPTAQSVHAAPTQPVRFKSHSFAASSRNSGSG